MSWSLPGPDNLRRSMGRKVAVAWHASFSIAAGVLYFFFVLPRWPELMGDTTHTLGTVLRIVTGALIGLAALPVVFTLLRTRKPEFGTPQLALTPADLVDRAARAGRRADHRHRDQRDLAQPGQRRALAVRHLRRRRGDRAARHLRVLPGVRRRAAAAAAQTAQAEGGEEGPRGRRKAAEDADADSDGSRGLHDRRRRGHRRPTTSRPKPRHPPSPRNSRATSRPRSRRENSEDDAPTPTTPNRDTETDDTDDGQRLRIHQRRSAQPARRQARSACVSASGRAAASPSTISLTSTGEPAHCHDVMRNRPQPKVSICPACTCIAC